MSDENSPDTTENRDESSNASGSLVNISINIKDISGFAKSCENIVSNVVHAVSRGVGTIYSPLGARLEGWSRRQEKIAELKHLMKLEELSERDTDKPPGAGPSLVQRAIGRALEDDIRKQINREDVAAEFTREMVHALPAPDAESRISDDWLGKFWNFAENISDDEVKTFFARLLVKEVTKPGSISQQTLQVLQTLSGDLARKFNHLCRLSIDDGESVVVIHPAVFPFQRIGPLSDYGIEYMDLFDLEGCGLLRTAEALMLNYGGDEDGPFGEANYAGQIIGLRQAKTQMNILQFTRAGREIRRLLPLEPIPAYTEALMQRFPNAFKFGK
jgi:hypothetical protein